MKKPFFAGFLEKQIDDKNSVEGGNGTVATNISTNLKLDAPTKPTYDIYQTMKYPSDGDEI